MAKFSSVNTRDIARAAGVSQSTVSRALRNDVRISEKTRRKVAQTARTLGYQVNPLVAAFTSQVRSHRRRHDKPRIAILETRGDLPPARQWQEQAAERIAQYDFHCETFAIRDFPDVKALGRKLRTRGIRGIFVPPVPLGLDLTPLGLEDLVIVTYGFSLRLPVHRVTPFHFQHMELALSELQRRGYCRVGFATTIEEDERVGHFWSAAFLEHSQRLHPDNRVPIYRDPDSYDAVRFAQWLQAHKPDAVISNPGYNYEFLRQAGYRVPEDVAYVSFGAQTDPSGRTFAGIQQQSEKVCAAAIDLIVAELYKNHYGLPETPTVTMIEGLWREGFSVPS